MHRLEVEGWREGGWYTVVKEEVRVAMEAALVVGWDLEGKGVTEEVKEVKEEMGVTEEVREVKEGGNIEEESCSRA